MNIIAWNVRGLNTLNKQFEVLKFLTNHKPTIVGLLENKLVDSKIIALCRSLPDNWKHVDNNDCGSKGRILIIWDTNIWNIIVTHKSRQHISLTATNTGGFICKLTYVYASNFIRDREKLWKDIHDESLNVNLPWSILGDFNNILNSKDKKGGNKVPISQMMGFQNCIMSSNLEEIPIIGFKYTWRKKGIATKIDKILCNNLMLQTLPDLVAFGISSPISDHIPLFLGIKQANNFKRNSPFRYVNTWHACEGYQECITEAIISNFWEADDRRCSKLYNFQIFLKDCKIRLKNWNFWRIKDSHISKELEQKYNLLLADVDSNPLDTTLYDKLKDTYFQWKEQCHVDFLNAKQKAKINWLHDGDSCTKLFHTKMSRRRYINNWSQLIMNNGEIIQNAELIESEAIKYFHNIFNSEIPQLDEFPEIPCLSRINEDGRKLLDADISLHEIQIATFGIADDKSPGPDGFSAKFFKHHWNDIKYFLQDAIEEFFKYGKMSKGLNHTFLSLIPKVHNPNTIADYRPIACCNVLYKIISKIICNRIKPFMPLLISDNQSAFIQGRFITDNILLAHEQIRQFNTNGSGKLCAKIDLRKAYDMINRNFICHMLKMMGFPNRLIKLIKCCISTPTFSININGSPRGFIKSSRGLRQGDPLSPFLFCVAMEFFSILMHRAAYVDKIKPIYAQETGISHLIYADDLMIFTKATAGNATTINDILEQLKNYAGLDINLLKSKVYFSKGAKDTTNILNILGMKEGKLPVKYLGVPLSHNYLKYNNCGDLFDKIRNRMAAWDCKLLSMAGKIELIHTVITPMVLYWMLTYQMPSATIDKINRMCANFVWSGKVHKISWNKLCRPKEEGGVGLRNFTDIKKAAALKLLWHYANGSSLWAKWMRERYCNNKNFWTLDSDNNSSGTWKNILKYRDKGLEHMNKGIANGLNTSLWFDPWVNSKTLVDLLGWDSLHLNGGINHKVSIIIQDGNFNLNNMHFLKQIESNISGVNILNNLQQDQWLWNNKINGFSFYSAWDSSRVHYEIKPWCCLIWNNTNSPRMVLCAYQAFQNRLTTNDRLISWGYQINPTCYLCNQNQEDREHLFFTCPYSSYLWTRCKLKLGQNLSGPLLLEDEAETIIRQFKDRDQVNEVASCSLVTVIYQIWLERNVRAHGGTGLNKLERWRLIELDVMYLMKKSKRKTKKTSRNEEILMNWGIELRDNG